jgi:localization factor PodJL
MRAELPWNVAGIPPEAREAARAAARREGLSVGEWLTRRILRSFSAAEEESGQTSAPLDAWGLPQSAASRRETEDMLARVSRTESEASDVYRRIEEQLRAVGRRLDSAERSQSENNRVMSKTASEINIATREQAQAFDQLAHHVVSMGDRLERLERSTAQEGLKEAVKALHQGLSRLADQITQTATQSGAQVSSLAGSIEQLAARLGEVRAEAEEVGTVLGQRISAVEKLSQLNYNALDHARTEAEQVGKALEARVTAIEDAWNAGVHAQDQTRADSETAGKALDQRLTLVEKAAQLNTNAMDHALERLEAQAAVRAGDLAEAQKRDTQTEVAIMRLEESLSRLEGKVQDSAVDRRLDGIDRSLADMVQRMDSGPADSVEESVRMLNQRVESLDKKHTELLAELRAGLPAPQASAHEPPPAEPPVEDPFASSPFESHPPFEADAEPDAFEAPPFAEAEAAPAPFGTEGFDPAAFPSDAADPFAEGFAPDHFEEPAFGGPGFEPPSEADAAPAENFLSAARRSAQAAAQAEAARSSGPFNWRRESKLEEEPARPRYLIPLVIGLLILLTLAGGLLLSQRMKASNPPPAPVVQLPAQTETPVPPPPGPTQPLPPESTAPATTPPAESAPAANPESAAPEPAKTAPIGAVSAGDRVAKLANAGNPVAETILGLKYLDGQGVPADVQQAGKWLVKAAEKGQAVAQYRLGTMYERGQGTAPDLAKAAKWYMASADQGNRKAMHNLAVAYADGALGKKDMTESARWFEKAAALGLSDSQFNLAVLYERGDGVQQSLIDAFKWYAIAAAQGDAESKQRLSVLQTQLSDADRAAAQKSAAAFRALPLNRTANVPPDVSDLPQ